MRRAIALLVAAVAAIAFLPAAAHAATVYQTFHIPTVDGEILRVEVQRDPQFDPQPVLLTYSPYNSTSSLTIANDAYATRYNPKGIARAKADVLGTRGSTGCWD